MNIQEAKLKLQEGHLMAREGWGSKGSFIFRQVPSEIPLATIPVMTSLPQPVKNEFLRRADEFPNVDTYQSIRYQNQIARVYPDNKIVNFTFSVADIEAEDWYVYDLIVEAKG